MPGLKLITGNRLEILAERLAEMTIQNPLASPLTPETVIVQSRGMERWLSMEIARRQMICANYRFPFPNAFVHEIFQKFIPGLPDQNPFDPDLLAWKIMELLPGLVKSPEFIILREYLSDDESGLKMFQLAQRLADTFDQYTVFRPEIILNWDNKVIADWQAILWQKLVGGNHCHRAAMKQRFLEMAYNNRLPATDLPERISIFGICALPPFHLEILIGLARLVDVNMFLMNPCREFWVDIASDRETDRLTRLNDKHHPSPADLHLEPGNSLLASTGALGRDFFWFIHQHDYEECETFEQPEEKTFLGCIQSDILNLRERGGGDIDKKSLTDDDDSIQVHSCHSPMREIEILYENLLVMFEADPDLKPRDILVMTPNIETYAPFIEAVFGTRADESQRIPFNITDRNAAGSSQVVKTFLAILGLRNSRFEASKVTAILEPSFVRGKFSLSGDDIELILNWIKSTRIRWGIDKAFRRQMGLPETDENTWKAGLDRMLLGYALPGRDINMFEGILPFDSIEGDKAHVLGKLVEFTDRLFASIINLQNPHSLEEWSTILTELCDNLIFAEKDIEQELLILQRSINKLYEIQKTTGFSEKVTLDIVCQYLNDQFERESPGFGFIAGAVTFCAMLPMRSIPFKIICLIGLDHDSYPRQAKRLSFDLIALNPRRGDRSVRNSDRYLFLEAILSARRKLYISYVGQSIEDNSAIPPSVLVSELVDYISQGFEVPGKNVLDHITTRHRLQAFSPEYFKGESKLISYSAENYHASQSILNKRTQPPAFLETDLPPAGDELAVVDLHRLVVFFSNPSRFLLRERLGVYLEEIDFSIEDREPYAVAGLEKYELENQLLMKYLAGGNIAEDLDKIRASGLLPHGSLGDSIYKRITGSIEIFAARLNEYRRGGILESIAVNYEIDGLTITGQLDNIFSGGSVQYRLATVKAKDRLAIWIKHLLYNIIKPDSYPSASILLGSDACYGYSPVENGRDVLRSLLNYYRQGLRRPLRFFPESSLKFADLVSRDKSKMYALTKAVEIWRGGDRSRGEGEDFSFRLCFGNASPMADDFAEIAGQIYRPLLEHEIKNG